MATQYYVGKRLSFDGQLCTVRYIGDVKGTKGEWLGVEWDDPARGKHSGEHAGIRYFQCLRDNTTAGSFIRPNRKSDTPRSFVEALKAKYASEDFEDPNVEIVFTTQPGDNARIRAEPLSKPKQSIRISGKEVEEVGFDKIRKQLAALSELKIVILDGFCMERPIARRNEGTDSWPIGLSDIKDASPKVIELDLSRNLFEEWREIASICEQLTNLRSLRVDGTRFRDTSLTVTEIARANAAFAHIKYLKLEDTLLPWEDMTRITQLFSDLTTFVASSNLYASLPSMHTPNPTIVDLSLEDNLFSTLTSLEPLTRLLNLRRLVLKSNKISAIGSTDSEPDPVFPLSLTEVDFSYNEIADWSFIDALQHTFPGLTSLRISHNPLFKSLQAPDGKAMTAEDGYVVVLARLANLKTLNFSNVLPKERLDAESYYLSLIAKEVSFAPDSDEERILKTHPRWKELCEEYGEPAIQRSSSQINPNSLAARLIRLELYQVGGKRVKIEIPKSATAYTLLGIVSQNFQIKPRACKMVWETGEWMPVASEDIYDDGEASETSLSEKNDESPAFSKVSREVVIIPGTRGVGTWIEGNEAVIRIEAR
ncbi:hypothetical protein DM02DRAFT_5528 [Periconia macrospinosa]|uniref:CAP-Gly domain-containing protein n=1 Tax=Periconia macrospinosa TaxID=97972 RepID=A0A2V1EDD9_9PLEO|nr:hypothetical protein DM02DRAFT_5528 [Periconia macrospinosa]